MHRIAWAKMTMFLEFYQLLGLSPLGCRVSCWCSLQQGASNQTDAIVGSAGALKLLMDAEGDRSVLSVSFG